MTPLYVTAESGHRCDMLSRVIDSAVTWTVESLTPLWQKLVITKVDFLWHAWLRCDVHSEVNDSAVTCTAESLTLLWPAQRNHWLPQRSHWLTQRSHLLRCDKNRQLQSRFSLRILIHIEKGFNPCLRGLGAVVWWKTSEVENLVLGSL
jgi:hypothetical protein